MLCGSRPAVQKIVPEMLLRIACARDRTIAELVLVSNVTLHRDNNQGTFIRSYMMIFVPVVSFTWQGLRHLC
ncbi:hypothetical protein BDV98DRAFT_336243 [Pterulicium gracile]|uniref:Uncharacterized protein n=1 Tax=Pterulicium gracile TaxID=1884261 RepID=A0A5C3Q456_9AGAR|nr:hypothetical protein BDV98DRAFT_336243 [Pterula gracilis]